MTETERAIHSFVAEEILLGEAAASLSLDTPLLESVDSLDLKRLVAFLEAHFGVAVSDDVILFENFENIRAIGSLVDGLRQPGR